MRNPPAFITSYMKRKGIDVEPKATAMWPISSAPTSAPPHRPLHFQKAHTRVTPNR